MEDYEVLVPSKPVTGYRDIVCKYEIFTVAMKIHIAVFCVMTPCRLVSGYHLQGRSRHYVLTKRQRSATRIHGVIT
jgi:hypothetical protein